MKAVTGGDLDAFAARVQRIAIALGLVALLVAVGRGIVVEGDGATPVSDGGYPPRAQTGPRPQPPPPPGVPVEQAVTVTIGLSGLRTDYGSVNAWGPWRPARAMGYIDSSGRRRSLGKGPCLPWACSASWDLRYPEVASVFVSPYAERVPAAFTACRELTAKLGSGLSPHPPNPTACCPDCGPGTRVRMADLVNPPLLYCRVNVNGWGVVSESSLTPECHYDLTATPPEFDPAAGETQATE